MSKRSFARKHLLAMARALYVMATIGAVVVVLVRLNVSGM